MKKAHNEKLLKLTKGFSLLDDIQQDYFMGILQAMVFTKKNIEKKYKKASSKKKIDKS